LTTLELYREKWREVPRGSDTDGRVFSTDLLKLSDKELLSAWEAMAEQRYRGELSWVGPLYRETMKDSRVLELGSGLGFDGLRFVSWGARWIFADIVPDNLKLIERVARLKGIHQFTEYFLIPDDLSFQNVSGEVDAIWVFGSIHHVPFTIARQEALNALSLLKVGGRWIELVYPRERWLREGALSFDQWGRITDGERTPWAEWHDAEKVRKRLEPAKLTTLLNFSFSSANYHWLDFRYEGKTEPTHQLNVDLLQEQIKFAAASKKGFWDRYVICPQGFFAEALRVPLIECENVTVELEIQVKSGVVGLFLCDASASPLPAAEAILDARSDSYLVTLRARDAKLLVVSNLHWTRETRFKFLSLKQK
jgi:hypothetical protein